LILFPQSTIKPTLLKSALMSGTRDTGSPSMTTSTTIKRRYRTNMTLSNQKISSITPSKWSLKTLRTICLSNKLLI
jgi:hypothetical protein